MSDLGDPSQLRYGPPAEPPVAGGRHTSRIPPAAWPVIVLLVAALAGLGCGAVVMFASLAASGDDNAWAELGAFVLGLLAAMVLGGVFYVVGLVLAARRAFPPGHRALPVTLALGLPVGFAALVLGAGGVADALGAHLAPGAGVVAGMAALAAGPLAFGRAGTAPGRRRLLAALAATVALVVAVAGVGIGVERARTDRLAARLPLVLFEGDTADAPFSGWRRDVFSSVRVSENSRTFTEDGHSAYLKYSTPGGAVFVTMHTDVGACADTVTYACRVDGTVGGGEQRTYTRVARYGGYPRSARFAVLVHGDGTAVSVSDPEPVRSFHTSSDVVLRSLVRVDRETFERATGAPLRFP
jgi:hypothetical protein